MIVSHSCNTGIPEQCGASSRIRFDSDQPASRSLRSNSAGTRYFSPYRGRSELDLGLRRVGVSLSFFFHAHRLNSELPTFEILALLISERRQWSGEWGAISPVELLFPGHEPWTLYRHVNYKNTILLSGQLPTGELAVIPEVVEINT